jgi:hypothetical protein
MRNVMEGSIHRGLLRKLLLKIGSQQMWELFAGVDGNIFVLIEFICKRMRAGEGAGLGWDAACRLISTARAR